ncbi:isocitrate lyase/PEP mutase family protein [Hominifimenecus sp. rT4P-3]|uniref:isocitrate lyase/PEP mutase family protein n=1 Tax=Hominifimenecus sp. rT4P-3 TaxID=3242979 RepID=UPI003DA430BF
MTNAAKFRELVKTGKPILMPGAYDPVSAKLTEAAGFDAIYLTGQGLASQFGFTDAGLVTLTEQVERAKYIVNSVHIPVICDADTGYGGILNVMRTVREFEAIGVAGIHIEDQVMPKKCGSMSNRQVIPTEEMIHMIQAAIEARQDPDFFICVRTDAIDCEGLDSAIERVKRYEAAGADCIMLMQGHGNDLEDFKRFNDVLTVPKWGVITETNHWVRHTPLWSAQELYEKCGFTIFNYPLALLYASAKQVKDTLDVIKREGTTQNWLDHQLSFQEFTTLMGLPEVYETERKYGRY